MPATMLSQSLSVATEHSDALAVAKCSGSGRNTTHTARVSVCCVRHTQDNAVLGLVPDVVQGQQADLHQHRMAQPLPEVLAAATTGTESALRLMPSLDGVLGTVLGRPPLLPQLESMLPLLTRLLLLLALKLPQLDRVLPLLVSLATGDKGRPVRRAVCSSFCCRRYFSLQYPSH